jgi:hypothetical protein
MLRMTQFIHRRLFCKRAGALLALMGTGAASVALLPHAAGADDPSGGRQGQSGGIAAHANQVRGDEITPQQQKAVEKGLKWLAAHQGPKGEYSPQVSSAGITGLCGLAFMSQGNLPHRGQYGEQVAKCVKFVCDSAAESGLISADQTHGPMYGHGFATLFLGEVYGMTNDPAVREKLQKAVTLIEKTQNNDGATPPAGGWRYQPVPYDADISVTICQVMALRAASDAGIAVDRDVITKAIQYVKNCQNADGGFSYVEHQMGGSGFARSAAGCATLYYAGLFKDGHLTKGLEYLKQFKPGANGAQSADMEGHYYYGNYYATQVMFLAGGDYWAQWYPAIRQSLLDRQQAGGNWTGDVSDDYSTALALIILQMPNRYLPVFNGKGPGG